MFCLRCKIFFMIKIKLYLSAFEINVLFGWRLRCSEFKKKGNRKPPMTSYYDYSTETISQIDRKACLFIVIYIKNIHRGIIIQNIPSELHKKNMKYFCKQLHNWYGPLNPLIKQIFLIYLILSWAMFNKMQQWTQS